MSEIDLRGRVESVRIERAIANHNAIGRLDDQIVLIDNADNYVGENCLVRFDLKGRTGRQGDPLGNFITSVIPPGFEGIGPEEYVLCGLWYPQMQKREEVPTLREYNVYFEPGPAGQIVYMAEGTSNQERKIRVVEGDHRPIKRSLPRIIRKELPNPGRYARVVIAETSLLLNKVADEIENQGLLAVIMEPRLSHAKIRR